MKQYLDKKQRKLEKKLWLEQQAFNSHIERTDIPICNKHNKENCIECIIEFIKEVS